METPSTDDYGRWRLLFRIKTSTASFPRATPLYHTVLELVTSSLASTLPFALFVLVGQGAKDCAGPSVCLSAALAAIASSLSGQCNPDLLLTPAAVTSGHHAGSIDRPVYISLSIWTHRYHAAGKVLVHMRQYMY
jgi:hypothetical protein